MDDPHLQLLGDNIRRLRKALRLTRGGVCRAGAGECAALPGLEAGKAEAKFPTLRKIRRALGCDWNTLMEGTEEDGMPVLAMSAGKSRERF